jgi:hypothetical protein
MWPIRRLCVGYAGMRQSSSSAEVVLPGPLVAPGESMRPISRYATSGPISIEQWTRLGRLSISGSAVYGMWRPRRLSSSRRPDTRAGRRTRSPWTATQRRTEQYARCEMREDGLLSRRTKLRSSRYLNNLIEQDHREIKFRTRPMLGFKSYESAAITIAGIELLRRIHKGQFALSRRSSSPETHIG